MVSFGTWTIKLFESCFKVASHICSWLRSLLGMTLARIISLQILPSETAGSEATNSINTTVAILAAAIQIPSL